VYSNILLVLCFSFITVTYADSATQTDWSGGPDWPGPVFYWGQLFDHESDLDWYCTSGILTLAYASEQIVAWDFERANAVFAIDIDGDADIDFFAAGKDADEVAWWENSDGVGVVWTKHSITDSIDEPQTVFAEDIDGDGDTDVISAAHKGNFVGWWENPDGSDSTWIEHVIDGNFDSPLSVCAGDIDTDGDIDVICGGTDSINIALWENLDGAGTSWMKHIIETEYYGTTCVYLEDIDKDGHMDIAATNFDYIVSWWRNADGSGTTWEKHIIDDNFRGQAVFVEDIDGDTDMDVLGGAWAYAGLTWWENVDGSGNVFAEHPIDSLFDGTVSVFLKDLDNDGDMDVVAASMERDEVAWWENIDGLGTTWGKHLVRSEFRCASAVHPEDIDGDGNIDILGASYWLHDIRWWDLWKTGYSSVGTLESSILDTQWNDGWEYIYWNSESEPGTSISFQVRASNDTASMGDWSDTLTVSCSLYGILEPGVVYVQYRAILESTNPDTTPILEDVLISWFSMGGNGDTAEPILHGITLLPILPNPVAGSPMIRFELPEPASVEFSIFDLSGRLISEIHGDDYFPGYHDVLLGDLSPGVYFCRMLSGDFTATQRFVVIG